MKHLGALILLLISICSFSQADFEALNDPNYRLVERMEIKSGSLKNDIHLTMKPYDRKKMVDFIVRLDTTGNLYLNELDYDNIQHYYNENNDIIPEQFQEYSANSIWKNFYKTPAHLFEINNEDIKLQVDPIFYGNFAFDNKVDKKFAFVNTRGAKVRATIDNKVSLWSSFTENQFKAPSYIKARVDSTKAIPGKGFYQPFKDVGYDYFEPKGGIAFDATKHINVQLGYDKNFIGDGYRSLFLSDNSNNAFFVKLNTQFWKINYTNLYQELLQDGRVGADRVKPKKYMVSHHLSFDASDRLNLGLFESIIFARENQFEFHYLNPIIFYRAVEQQVGSPDNAGVGANYSYLIPKLNMKLYGQVYLDEFIISELRSGDQSKNNKYAFQQGVKYIDAFGVDQLDLQAEVNRARPYTYMHGVENNNYLHYGQPLAHPLGTNFTEITAIADYQPYEKIRLHGMISAADYGRDPDARSWGGDLDKLIKDVPFTSGVKTGQGVDNKTLYFEGLLAYEMKHNLFLDFQAMNKTHKIAGQPTFNEIYAGAALRLNFVPVSYNY